MGKLFRNKYHIGSIRYKGYDYSSPGMYYVNICTKDRIHYFGEIKNGEMILSGIGEVVNDEWLKTPSIRHGMNITLDEFVVMPDHFHAIIIIGENQYNQYYDNGQSKFHDNIIRTNAGLSRIRTYIKDNPSKWGINPSGL